MVRPSVRIAGLCKHTGSGGGVSVGSEGRGLTESVVLAERAWLGSRTRALHPILLFFRRSVYADIMFLLYQ